MDIGTEPSYLVRYRVLDPSGVVKRNIEDTAEYVEVFQTGMVVGGLEPHLVYGVSVAAKNDMGVGDYSPEIIAECEFYGIKYIHLLSMQACHLNTLLEALYCIYYSVYTCF